VDPSAAVLSHLAGASIRSLCLAILALLALRLGRVRSASVKHAVWTITLGAMLSLPFLTPFLPPLPVPILPGAKSAIEEPVPQVFTVTVPPLPGYGQSRAARPSWQRLLLALYCGALLVMLGRLIVSCLLVRRLVRSRTPIRDAAACGALKRLAHGRTPALRESGRISVPMTAGWIKPDILLPSSWRDWDEAALVHELAHVRRGIR
jgi:beta-lactamase regulating signal transducer with metallopeptidase domain